MTDAAGWNRNMWDEFGIKTNKCSCEHPIDPNRQLYFLSDWCHLLKCMRNLLCPEPPRKKKRKEKVHNNDAEEENPDDPGAMDHTAPVEAPVVDNSPPPELFFNQFFSEAVAAAMEYYRSKGVPGLEDSEPTEKFIRRIHEVAEAMNSKNAKGALWPI